MLVPCFPGSGRPAAFLEVPNPGFERVPAGGSLPDGWQAGIGGGAQGGAAADRAVAHCGGGSLRIWNRSSRAPFVYVVASSRAVSCRPSTTYMARFYVRGIRAKGCYFAVSFQRDGLRRQELPAGTFGWQPVRCRFTTPPGCSSVTLIFGCDDITEGIWVDDVSVERSSTQLGQLVERRYPKSFAGVWPRSKGPLPRHLLVYDCTHGSEEAEFCAAALQGLVNRTKPRLYLIHRTNPPRQDWLWLRALQQMGYTGSPVETGDLPDVVARFRKEVRGAVIYDPHLLGSINAACMIGAVRNALPCSPALAARLGLPVVADLRGRWRRSVDAYRYVFARYWPRMCHHVLAWVHPLSGNGCFRDYVMQHRIFCFWISSPGDGDAGADPEAEREFVEEVLAATPANIPVMGWPSWRDAQGVSEYEGVRLLSEYGKFVPGTEFCTNLSIHTAVSPPASLLRQRQTLAHATSVGSNKVYLSVNVLDSGDALWYWQLHQREIWADPERGKVPIGWSINPTIYDMLPAVLQWYIQHATARDRFFGAVSGLGYMNTQVYANRFCPKDRSRIWAEYVRLTGRYCRLLGLDGIALYNGSWSEPTPPHGVLERFVRGMPWLRYILADLGRHENVRPADADGLLGATAVFHTITRFRPWAAASDVSSETMEKANAWLVGEIEAHTPPSRPAFVSAMAISWYYTPRWFADLRRRLPAEYVLVGPEELARLYRTWRSGRAGHIEAEPQRPSKAK